MTTTSVSLEQKTIDRADRIVDDRVIPGVKDRSGLIEYALRKLFEEIENKEANKQ